MTCNPTVTCLQDGETLHLPLDAHTTLRVARGTVVVRQPLRWLGETVVAPLVTLQQGQSCQLEQGGWIALRATDGAAEVRSERPAPAWRTAWWPHGWLRKGIS